MIGHWRECNVLKQLLVISLSSSPLDKKKLNYLLSELPAGPATVLESQPFVVALDGSKGEK